MTASAMAKTDDLADAVRATMRGESVLSPT